MDPQQGPPQPDLLIGQTIGNYLVTQKLGEGGMGSVYLAEHPSIGKKVALKVLHSEFSTNQEVAARFFHEAKAVNDIGHPNIVDIVDFGILQAGGGREQLVYFIMEYLAGQTLSQLIRGEAPLPPERALMIGLQVADALSASHKCGIVHRDLKPDNIILLQRGRERDFVKLLDFGIAKLTGGSAIGSHRTRTGIVMGTPAYMSPEQCEGRQSVDLRTDIYALGIVMYEMLTGRVPFLGEGYGEILVQHLTQPPVPPSQFRMLSPHVELVVMKALEKRADMRYPTMDEFMRAMSDPVGYVEAHGGVTAFLQRQLTPSSGPIPSGVRLTPAPSSLPTIAMPQQTPIPGSLHPPRMSGSLPPGTSPGMNAAPTTPTTLGSSTGQIQQPRSRTGFAVISGVVVAATVIAIVLVVRKDRGPVGGPQTAGSAGEVVAGPGSGSEGSVAGVRVKEPGAGQGQGTAIAIAAGSDSAGGGGTTAGTTAGSDTGATGGSDVAAGSNAPDGRGGEPGAGSAGEHVTKGDAQTVKDELVKLTVTSTPAGAKIQLNGKDTGKVTPATLELKKDEKASIVLTRRGYDPFTLKADTGASATQSADLVRTRTSTPTVCRGPQRAGCQRDSKGCCLPDTGTGRGSGSARPPERDRDSLMTPD